MALRIFVVDDDPDYIQLIRYQLEKLDNVNVDSFNSGEDALDSMDLDPDLVLLDVVMPGRGGLETLRSIKENRPSTTVVMVSAQSAVSVALDAMRLGATDYITKGQDDTVKLKAIVEQTLQRVLLSREIEELRSLLPARTGVHGLVGESEAMANVFRTIKKTLRGDLTVAIVGESGTGKELVAQAIHYNSPRRREPFVLVNCAAIPRDLMESEFFGHEKGSFTGAHARKIGKFEQAHGGTIFLDEIGELDLSLQAKLLRVLQSQELQRVGGQETIRVNVRILSATNRDIRQMIEAGEFREDLYYRLFQFPIQIPPLRSRGQDVLMLAEHFRSEFLKSHPDVDDRSFSSETRRVMMRYRWPGNVRELKSAVERALLISDTADIIPADLMLDKLPISAAAEVDAESIPGSNASAGTAQSPDDIIPLEEVKLNAVVQAYEICEGNINQTANRLGVTRSTIYRLLKKAGIESET